MADTTTTKQVSKDTLIREVADLTGMTQKDTKEALDAAFQVIHNTLAAGGRVQLHSFGTFQTKKRASRTVQAPSKVGDKSAEKQTVVIPERNAVVFTPASHLKAAVNK